MDKASRKKLVDIIDQLSAIRDEIEEMKDMEEDAFGNLFEDMQESERGERIQNNIASFEGALESFEEMNDYLLEIIGN